MALPQGIDFRETAGFITDPANHTSELTLSDPGNYPTTTPQGNTVGYEGLVAAQIGSRDRLSTNDARLAGLHFTNTASIATYRIDLPAAGVYKIRIALGDASYAQNAKCELFDDTTSLGVLSSTATTAANNFRDATDAEYSAANWPASNTAVVKTFASTICRFKMGSTAAATYAWAHVYVESSGGAAALAGDATDTATAAAQLTTSLPFNGGAVSVATANGLFTNAIDFNGSASAGVNVAGDLFTQLKFDGAALADALAQAALTTGIPFDGAAAAQAGGGGDITVQISLLGAAVANALAQGDLTGASGFAGAAAAQALAAADITTDIPLTGNPQAYASATGGLTTILPLNGVSAAVNNVTGDLTVAIRFNAQALALALASAEFTVQIRFNGAALAQAAASGTLAGTAPMPSLNPRYMVEIEPRLYEAEIAPRLYEVAL